MGGEREKEKERGKKGEGGRKEKRERERRGGSDWVTADYCRSGAGAT